MISTGSPRLDALTGGLRPGTITAFTGDEDVGLSLIAKTISKNAGFVLYMDADCKVTESPSPRACVYQDTDLESAWAKIDRAIGTFDLVVVDTANSLDAAPDLPTGFDTMQATKRRWKDLLRSSGVRVAANKTALLVLMRASHPIFPIIDRSSTRVDLVRRDPINYGSERVGHWIEASANGGPYVRIPIYYDRGFDPAHEARLKK